MAVMKKTKALLALEDGTVFEGTGFGAIDSKNYSTGELVFNTSITGYQEILTDPSYCEQIILFTSVHIGNVGINIGDYESNHPNKIWSNGIVIKSLSKNTSNWRSTEDLNGYLVKNNMIGISDIDTRAVTNVLRNNGSMRCCIYIVKDDNLDLQTHKEHAVSYARLTRELNGLDLAKEVTTSKKYTWQNKSLKINPPVNQTNNLQSTGSGFLSGPYHIVAYDFGIKSQIANLLKDRSCNVTIVPADTTIEEVLSLKPDGVLLSNGPGDPKACEYAVNNTKKLINLGVPVFGICLGFQILALALGAKTTKMKFGHHGGNHPVKDLINENVLITSQNHGFMVDEQSLTDGIVITHRSLFDQTVQGIKHKRKPVFGFQGHPEASPGPNDIEYLFDDFIKLVREYKTSLNQNNTNKVSTA